MTNFSLLPPEVYSRQMFSGPGSAPMLAVATACDGLASELGLAASAFSSMTSQLAGSAWQGRAPATIAAAVASYAQWLSVQAAKAGSAAAQAKAAVAVYETARAATVHPSAVRANRTRLASLVRSNLLGLDAPAIAAVEGEYERMWVQDAAAMAGYHGSPEAKAPAAHHGNQQVRLLQLAAHSKSSPRIR